MRKSCKVMIKEEFNTILPIPGLESFNDDLKEIIIQYIGEQEVNHINLQCLQHKRKADWVQSLKIESPGRFNYFWPIKGSTAFLVDGAKYIKATQI